MVRLLTIAFCFILILGVVALVLPDGSDSEAPHAESQTVAAQVLSPASDTEIARDASGKFQLTGQANGEDVRFVVDTGADVVALTVIDAERLGIEVDPDSFEPVAQTAAGIGYGAHVRIDRLTIADQDFTNVEALVMDGLQANLLGQSVLRQMGKLEMHPEKLIIRRS